MAWPLRQSTASQEIPLGPFVDDTDGKTAETALSIANTDIKLQKFGATSQANKNSGGATHIATGDFYAVLDATDSDTLGPMRVKVHVAGALPVWLDCVVMPANVYDALYGTDKLEVDVLQVGGDTQSATDLKDFADAGYDPATNKVEGVKLADTLTTYTGNTPQTGDNFVITNSGTHGNAALKTLIDGVDTDVAAFREKVRRWLWVILNDDGADAFPTEYEDIASTEGIYDPSFTPATHSLSAMRDGLPRAVWRTSVTDGVVSADEMGGLVDAIRDKTVNLPSDPADASDIAAALTVIDDLIDTEVAAVLTLLQSGTHGLAALKTLVDGVDTDVAALQEKVRRYFWMTLNTPDIPAWATELDEIAGVVGAVQPTYDQAYAISAVYTKVNERATPAQVEVAVWDTDRADHTAAGSFGESFAGIIHGACVAGSTTTQIRTNLTEATNDHYNGRAIVFVTGALIGQGASITDYDGSTKYITVSAMTEAPANTDRFVIV